MNPFAAKSISIPVALILCAFLGIAAAQVRKDAVSEDKTIRVQVEMVSLPVVVTDRNGNHVNDLKKEDFLVLEDGILQEISGFSAVEEPISVALLLDASGSTELQLERIRQDAVRFVQLLRPDDSVAIIAFADEVTVLEQFSIYHKKNPDVIRQIKPGGLSAVYEAVWLSIEQVLKHEFGRKALVILSDGVDNRSESVTKEETLDLARKTDSTIYCVYFDTKKDRDKLLPPTGPWPRIPFPAPKGETLPEYAIGREYLSNLTRYGGGLLIEASRIENVGSAFGRIIKELSNQYSVGYYPKNLNNDGRFRNVEVRVKRSNLSARTRQGYYCVPRP